MDHPNIRPQDHAMRCPICEARYADGSRFCAHDGHALVVADRSGMSDSERIACAPTLIARTDELKVVSQPQRPVAVSAAPRRSTGHPLLVDGRYLKVRQLGDGGQGQVWLVQDIHTGRMLALKNFQGDMDIERCRAEVDAAARIEDHSHIVKIHDLHRESEGGGFFMTMEYLEGETLEARMERAPLLGTREALALLAQVSRGLAEMHDKGLVHRDVKPANIMLVPGEAGARAKLLDLGIAKSLRPGVKALTMPGWVVGTLDYAAPEQLRGEPVTPAFDMYALGVVAHELLEGYLPGATPVATRPLPNALRRLIGRMLDVEPTVRPANMREVESELLAVRAALGAKRGLLTALRLDKPMTATQADSSEQVEPALALDASDQDGAEVYRIPRHTLVPRALVSLVAAAAAAVTLFAPSLPSGGEDKTATLLDGQTIEVAGLYAVPDICTPGIRGDERAC